MDRLFNLADRIDDNQEKINYLEEELKSNSEYSTKTFLCKRIELQIKLIDDFLMELDGMEKDVVPVSLHNH